MSQLGFRLQNFGRASPLRQSFSICLALSTAMLIHRLLVLPFLGFDSIGSMPQRLLIVGAGLLGDLWVGIALAISLVLSLRCLRAFLAILRIRLSDTGLGLSLGFVTLILIFLSGVHVPYVKFFRAQINPFHLSYMVDPEFIGAGLIGLADLHVFLVWAAAALVFVGCLHRAPEVQPKSSLRRSWSWVLSLLILGGCCQALKVQLIHNRRFLRMVPTVMAENGLEQLLTGIASMRKPRAFKPASLETLGRRLGLGNQAKDLNRIFRSSPRPAEESVGLALKTITQERVKSGKPLLQIIVLLESATSMNSRFFTPSIIDETLTPFLDQLAGQAIAFQNAYSVSNVTRVGMEASYCGLFTDRDSSVMRSYKHVKPECLSGAGKAVAKARAYNGFWHGGHYNYDNQGSFFKRIELDRIFTEQDFSEKASRVFWGVSDQAALKQTLVELAKIPADKTLQSHLLLTLNNHPDWLLPDDAPLAELSHQTKPEHPSYKTTLYQDLALKEFIQGLKDTQCAACQGQSLWDNAVVYVLADHGTVVPTLRYPNGLSWGVSTTENAAAARSSTKIPLIMTGGLVNAALAQQSLKSWRSQRTVSQVDVFATASELIGASVTTIGDSLFARSRRFPVLGKLGDYIYLPDQAGISERLFKVDELDSKTQVEADQIQDLVRGMVDGYGELLRSSSQL